MTYREKWKQDHPDEEFSVGGVGCPSTHGYRAKETVNDCKPRTCTQCWNGEIPEEKSVEQPDDPLIVYGAGPLTSIKDSGDRTEFETGAVRDMREGKGRCDLMPLEVAGRWMSDNIITNLGMFLRYRNSNDTSWLYQAMSMFVAKRFPTNGTDDCNKANQATILLEVAKHFEEGAKKYGEDNWRKGIPVHCYIDSAVRHYLKWLRGDNDEPHDRAFVWNIMCCIWEADYRDKKEEHHDSDAC